jgi:hypothetical protein
MTSWKQFFTRAAALAALTGLAACGGGDGGGSGIRSISASQQSADKFVAEVNGLVDDIRQADAADQIPSAGPFGFSAGASSNASLPTGAVITETLSCSDFGTAGSGSLGFTMDYNSSSGKPNFISFSYNDCSFGDSGYTYSIDGTGKMTFERYVAEDDFTFVLTYDLTYSYSGDGVSDSVTVESTEVCTIQGESIECRYRIGDYDIASFLVESEGSLTTIHEATIESSDVTIVFDGWMYDSSLGRATAGMVLITDADGNSAQITATGSGYTVVTVVDGATSTWTVTIS